VAAPACVVRGAFVLVFRMAVAKRVANDPSNLMNIRTEMDQFLQDPLALFDQRLELSRQFVSCHRFFAAFRFPAFMPFANPYPRSPSSAPAIR
jgi:hypothetical protein